MADFKDKIADVVKSLTWRKLALYTVAATVLISGYTTWENRQNLFNRASMSLNNTVDDYALEAPSKVGQTIVNEYMKKNPAIIMLTIVDANPINNTRTAVYRSFNDLKARTYVHERVTELPSIDNAALFTADAESNKQVLAMLNGEFMCSPTTAASDLARAFPQLLATAKWQCRVPLPPSFGKATGWFTLYLGREPSQAEYDTLKVESLMMSLNYYNLEVLKAGGAPSRS